MPDASPESIASHESWLLEAENLTVAQFKAAQRTFATLYPDRTSDEGTPAAIATLAQAIALNYAAIRWAAATQAPRPGDS